MKRNFLIISLMVLIGSCSQSKSKEDLKNEIFQTEKAFEKMASEKGISQAFYFYADDNAVIRRENDTLIIGRNNIRLYYERMDSADVTVNWTPDFIDVSASGDLAYTYGRYTWILINNEGDSSENKGVFHTVWKLQKDNSWKYVWD